VKRASVSLVLLGALALLPGHAAAQEWSRTERPGEPPGREHFQLKIGTGCAERPERAERPGRVDRSERVERAERPSRVERVVERPDRIERLERRGR
jgi:hypothetical protein